MVGWWGWWGVAEVSAAGMTLGCDRAERGALTLRTCVNRNGQVPADGFAVMDGGRKQPLMTTRHRI